MRRLPARLRQNGPDTRFVPGVKSSPRNVTFAKSGARHILAGWQRTLALTCRARLLDLSCRSASTRWPPPTAQGSCPGAPCWSRAVDELLCTYRVPVCRRSHRIRRRGWTGRTGDGGDRGGRLLSVSRALVYRRIMLKRKIELRPEHLYPAGEWRIVEARYSDEFVGLTETVFSLGYGFVGVRGSFEEGARRRPRDIRQLPHRGGRSAAGRHPGSRTCSAPGPRSRSRCRHHDRDAACESSVSSARAQAPPRRGLRARRARP